MPGPRSSSFARFVRVQPVRKPGDGAVFAVGCRAVVTSGEDDVPVQLTGEDGHTAGDTLRDCVEVEIVAWRPRRAGGTLYRVRAIDGATEGWLGAAQLRALPPVAKPPVQAAPHGKPAKPSKRPVKSRTAR